MRALSEDDEGVQAMAYELKGEAERRGISVKELQRRMRISAKAKGRTPWNKGKAWDDEMKARISEATKAAMGRPDVRAKLCSTEEGTGGGDQGSDGNREDQGSAVGAQGAGNGSGVAGPSAGRGGTGLRTDPGRQSGAVDSGARGGMGVVGGQSELAEGGKGGAPRPGDSRPGSRAPAKARPANLSGSATKEGNSERKSTSSREYKSPEHRKAISDAIRAKWQDPEYRARVAQAREKKAAEAGLRSRAVKKATSRVQSRRGGALGADAATGASGEAGATRAVRKKDAAMAWAQRDSPVTAAEGDARAEAEGEAEGEAADRDAEYVGEVVPSLGRPLTVAEHKMLVMRRAMQLKKAQQGQGSPPRDRVAVGAAK